MAQADTKLSIIAAIEKFQKGNLTDNSLSLFKMLGYNTERQQPFEKKSYAYFKEFFLDNDTRFNKEKALVPQWDYIDLLFQLSRDEISNQLDLFDTKQVDRTIYESYLFFAIKLSKKQYSRTALSQITREINKVFSMPVMVLFKHGKTLTLSVINRRPHKGDEQKDVLEKVTLIKDISTEKPHRAHIEILFELSLSELKLKHSITNFVALHNAWQKTLDLKELNEKFYQEVSAWYYCALTKIKLPIKPDFYKDDKENVKHFAVRLISRILFCWFLKEMKLIDRDLLEIDFDKAFKLLKNITQRNTFFKQNGYYRSILQNIFFSSLNTPQEERQSFYFAKSLAFDIDKFKKIPFLNGGLFDKLEEDNCNDCIDDDSITIPNELFYSENLEIRVDKHVRKTKGLNKIFEQYKFTVDENTSLEQEVALDPELLGLIFENLLAEIDPNETISTTARRASGSFYTPRNVIEYMVNESLLLHLNNYFAKNNFDATNLKNLIYYERVENDKNEFKHNIIQAVDQLKVLDPACGSGAFPMGMLHKLVRILKVVDPDNNLWIDAQLNRLQIELREQAKKDLHRHELNYARKIGIIRNSIYSIDIKPMAVMISKLRFFISLLIEQDINLSDAEHNYHISPLPNLETKIICANTLKDASPQMELFGQLAIEKLIPAKEKYYQNSNLSNKAKDELLDKIIDTLHQAYPDFAKKVTGKKIADSKSEEIRNKKYLMEWFKHANISAPFFNLDIFFPELKGAGFNIVIGNPPYGGDKISDDIKNTLSLGSKDPYGAFIARFLASGSKSTPLKSGGILAYIVSDTFMTIKSHFKLRKQIMDNYIYKMIRVHPDTFKATVNTAIILCERNVFPEGERLEKTKKNYNDNHQCLMADLTTVSIHDNHDRFLELLYQTTDAEIIEDIEKEGDKLPVLKMQRSNWASESSEEYAIYTYRQNLIETNSNLPFFVASPKLFSFMNDKTSKKKDMQIGDKQVRARLIEVNGKEIPVIKLSEIADVKAGLQTGDNYAYLFKKPYARGSYRSIDAYKEYLLTDDDLNKIRNNDDLRLSVIDKGISKNNSKSTRYFDGRYIVPYDKGGASDAGEGWLPNYYVPTDYFIDWSEWAINRMKSYTIAQRIRDRKENKKITPHSKTTLCAVIRNPEKYFTVSISYSRTGDYSPTFRYGSKTPFDSKSNAVFISEQFIGLLNSTLFRFLFKVYQIHTVQSEGDTLLESPLVTTKIKDTNYVRKLVEKQKQNPRYNYASNEQVEIDRLVYVAYELNEDDIKEVENWYARRYPKLAKAQRENLRKVETEAKK